MSPRRMKMHHVVRLAGKNRAEPQARCGINRIPDPQRTANDTCGPGMLPKLTVWVAQQFDLMAVTEQVEGQTHHLGFAATETSFRIDCGYS